MTRIRHQIEESVGKGGPPIKDEPSSSSGIGKSFIRAGAAPGSNRSSNNMLDNVAVPPSTQSHTRCGNEYRSYSHSLLPHHLTNINTHDFSHLQCMHALSVCYLSGSVPPLHTPSHLTRTPRTWHPSMCRHRAQRILQAPLRLQQPITP